MDIIIPPSLIVLAIYCGLGYLAYTIVKEKFF